MAAVAALLTGLGLFAAAAWRGVDIFEGDWCIAQTFGLILVAMSPALGIAGFVMYYGWEDGLRRIWFGAHPPGETTPDALRRAVRCPHCGAVGEIPLHLALELSGGLTRISSLDALKCGGCGGALDIEEVCRTL